MSRQLFEEARKVLTQEAAVKLDPVGQEDKDVDNDGDADKTDSYLKKRRGAISAAIAKSKNESALSEEDIAKLKAILGESDDMGPEKDDRGRVMMVHKTSGKEMPVVNDPETIKRHEKMGYEKKESVEEEVEQVDEMQVANKYALKGPQPADVPAYMRKGNARKQFPVKLDDLKRKDTMSDIENLRKMEEVDLQESDGPVVWKKGAHSIEKMGDAEFALYVGDKKTKMFSSLDAAKGYAMKKEEVEQTDEAMSPQAKTTMKHIPNPTAGEKKAAKDIKPGIAGYRDRIDMLKSAEARGGLKKEEAEQEDFELIEKLNFEVPENPSYQDYFKAALKMAQVESFAELDEEDQQYIMNEMENAFRENDTSFILEADMMGDMNDTVQRLRKAGHKVEDMGRDFKGNPFYVYIDKGSSMRRKVTYKGNQKVTQNMGRAQPEKEEDNQ